MKFTSADLKQRQSLPLEAKIRIAKTRIREWYEAHDGNVYVAFSGGKDSTVLAHIVGQMYNDVPLVFVDTGLEYPEIRTFVKSYGEKVVWLRPEKNFKRVIQEYGYPLFGKETAQTISDARRGVKWAVDKLNGTGRYENSRYKKSSYMFMLKAPFEVSEKCCDVMKKAPAYKYEKETGRVGFTAEMAEESLMRKNAWLRHGSNAFDAKRPKSKPLATWTEQDVLAYIAKFEVPIATVYGEVVPDYGTGEFNGQISLGLSSYPLKLTGAQRTGCMFCGFGCHLEKEPTRFQNMKKTHPKLYEYVMKPKELGGLGYKEVLDWINQNSDKNIKY